MYLNKKYALMRCHNNNNELFMEFWNDEEKDCFSITQSKTTHRILFWDYFEHEIEKLLMFKTMKTPTEWMQFIEHYLIHNDKYIRDKRNEKRNI